MPAAGRLAKRLPGTMLQQRRKASQVSKKPSATVSDNGSANIAVRKTIFKKPSASCASGKNQGQPASLPVGNREQVLQEFTKRTAGMTLDEKMSFFRNHADPEDIGHLKAIFDQGEIRKMYGRFKTAREKHSQAQAEWDGIKSRGIRQGMEHAQRVLLMAWLSEPGFSENYFSITQTVTLTESINREERWISLKQLYDKYGEEEAEEMLNMGLIDVRDNPRNLRRKQYLDTTDSANKSFSRARTMGTAGRREITGEQHIPISNAMLGVSLQEGLLHGNAAAFGLDHGLCEIWTQQEAAQEEAAEAALEAAKREDGAEDLLPVQVDKSIPKSARCSMPSSLRSPTSPRRPWQWTPPRSCCSP